VSDETTQAALANTSPAATTAASDGDLPGGTIVAERWTIVRFLARGGMGEVYEAHDRLLDGPVALKTLRSSTGHERFVREIQLARKVTHPNVCRIHDAGRHGSLSFLTMELLAGEPLSARIRRGPMPVIEARPILEDLAAALDAAHAAGVIHRDFKPHNVMLVPRGGATRAVVTDFGIARAADDDGAVALTAVDELVGTPAYMAPEQVGGKPVTAATDIFSFGVVAYEMVTGSLPFLGANPREIATARLTETPRPPRELVPALDPRWDAAIMQALARRPAERPASASAMLEMTRVPPTTQPPVIVERVKRVDARLVLLAVVALPLVALAVALVVVWLAGRDEPRAPVTTAAEAIDASTISPQGAALFDRGQAAYEAGRYDEAISWFVQVDETQQTPAMVYNMAQAYRRKGDVHMALVQFRRFLKLTVNGGESPTGRELAERYVRELEAEIAGDGGVAP
jgi:hypothetical protein